MGWNVVTDIIIYYLHEDRATCFCDEFLHQDCVKVKFQCCSKSQHAFWEFLKKSQPKTVLQVSNLVLMRTICQNVTVSKCLTFIMLLKTWKSTQILNTTAPPSLVGYAEKSLVIWKSISSHTILKNTNVRFVQ